MLHISPDVASRLVYCGYLHLKFPLCSIMDQGFGEEKLISKLFGQFKFYYISRKIMLTLSSLNQNLTYVNCTTISWATMKIWDTSLGYWFTKTLLVFTVQNVAPIRQYY